MPPPFVPKVTPAQANAIITAPGSPFETELLKVPYRGDKCPPLKVYKNLPPTIGSVFFSAVNQFADREYLKLYSGNPKAFDEEFKRGSLVTLTYGQAKDQVIKLMWILKEKYGIKKGDKVGIAAKNSPAWALVFWAAVSLGAVLVGANAWLLGGELEYCLDLADVKVLLVDSERMERLLGKKESGGSFLDALFGKGKLEAVVVEGAIPRHEFGSKVAGFEQLLVGPSRAEPAITDVRPDDDAIILFTSGTTGLPKASLHTHRNTLTNLFTIATLGLRTFLRRGDAPPAPPTAQRSSLIGTPLFHVGGLHCNLIPSTLAGSLVIMMSKWDPSTTLDIAVNHNLTSLGGVPYQSLTLLSSPKFLNNPELMSRIESVGGGGAPVPRELVENIERLLPKADKRWEGDGFKGLNGFGLTESAGFVVMNMGEDYFLRPESIGLPSPINEVIIAPQDISDDLLDREPPVQVKDGEIGEIWIRGINIMKSYYRNPTATASTITPTGFLRTGDLGLIRDGFVYQLDRAKDMIIRAGENVYSVEVENRVLEVQGVEEVTVVGVPHPRLGEEVACIVTLKPGAKVTGQDIIKHCRSKMAAFKCPSYVHFKPEGLPKNATGKVLKREVKEEVVALLKAGKLGVGLPPAAPKL